MRTLSQFRSFSGPLGVLAGFDFMLDVGSALVGSNDLRLTETPDVPLVPSKGRGVIDVAGGVFGDGYSPLQIYPGVGGMDVTLRETGQIIGTDAGLIMRGPAQNVRITVHGEIDVRSAAVYAGSTGDVFNHGVLSGFRGVWMGTEGGTLLNTGVILYEWKGVSGQGGTSVIVNTGYIGPLDTTLEGRGAFDDGPGRVNLDLTNTGLIVGDITADGTSIIHNTGAIVGDVTISGRYTGDGEIEGHLNTRGASDRLDLKGAVIDGNVNAGGGNDILDLRGADVSGVVSGGTGNDRFIVGSHAPHFVGGGGNDTVWAHDSHTLSNSIANLRLMEGGNFSGKGNEAGNRIHGNSSNNALHGGAGRDKLYGKDGKDTLVDGAGRDHLFGGPGADRFVFVSDGEPDWIKDFEPGIDTIDMRAWGAGLPGAEPWLFHSYWTNEIFHGDERLVIGVVPGPYSIGDLIDGLIF